MRHHPSTNATLSLRRHNDTTTQQGNEANQDQHNTRTTMMEERGEQRKPDADLLSRLREMIEVERSITAKLETVEPWLSKSTSSRDQFKKRVRPIPRTMQEVQQVLAVARNYSARTSAPAGWNPNAPVVGFCTPNPLPHQLRGGALATLQLNQARQSERDKKRKREEEEEAKARETKKKAAEEEAKNQSAAAGKTDDPSSGNAKTQQRQQSAAGQSSTTADRASQQPRNRAPRNQPRVIATTMNLSDSSSSSSDDDDDSDED